MKIDNAGYQPVTVMDRFCRRINSLPSSRQWILCLVTLFTFFFLLGSRSLNESDEGRYAEISREMVESGNWLVPHFWYLPHFDKPPVIYWAVAESMRLFGTNEWAVRIPLALAGISGVVAAYFLALSIAGKRVAFWTVLILQTSALYFGMSRVVTPDMFLTQFIAWTIFFFWKAWNSQPDLDLGSTPSGTPFLISLLWTSAGWLACAGGFLSKGPIAVLIPLSALIGLFIYKRSEKRKIRVMSLSLLLSFPLFIILILPWFLKVFAAVPESWNFMVFGQVFGHYLGTAIKNRPGGPHYFFVILAIGFLPWTWVLFRFWSKPYWQTLSPKNREGWVYLLTGALFTFVFFTCSRSKLPAYILPMFVPLAVLTAMRFFITDTQTIIQSRLWKWVLQTPIFMAIAIPIALMCILKRPDIWWTWGIIALFIICGVLLYKKSRDWTSSQCAGTAVFLMLINMLLLGINFPQIETSIKSSQTLKPLGIAIRNAYHPGDRLVCWGGFPQGLPFYAAPLMNDTNRFYLGGTSFKQVPFEFPGNRERMGKWVLSSPKDLDKFLTSTNRVLVAGFQGTFEEAKKRTPTNTFVFLTKVGRWELFVNHD